MSEYFTDVYYNDGEAGFSEMIPADQTVPTPTAKQETAQIEVDNNGESGIGVYEV